MQVSKKFLQAGAHLALFLAVSVAAVSSAQAGVDFGIEEDSNAAPVAPAKPKPTLEQFQAIKTLEELGVDWELYFSDFLEAQKAGIEFQSKGDLSAYGETKKLLKVQSLTPEQFKAGLIIKNHFNDRKILAQRNYLAIVLEAQKAGIEIKDSTDLFLYKEIRPLLKGGKPTQKQFQAAKDFKKTIKSPPSKQNLLEVFEAQKAGIEIKTWGDLSAYGETKKLLKVQSLTPEQFKAGLIVGTYFKGNSDSLRMSYFKNTLEAQEAGIEIQNWEDLKTYEKIKELLEIVRNGT